jgi:hypothetical protein
VELIMILSTSSMIAFGLGGSLSYLAVRWSAARAQALALKEEAKRAAQQAHAQTEALNKRAERRAKSKLKRRAAAMRRALKRSQRMRRGSLSSISALGSDKSVKMSATRGYKSVTLSAKRALKRQSNKNEPLRSLSAPR